MHTFMKSVLLGLLLTFSLNYAFSTQRRKATGQPCTSNEECATRCCTLLPQTETSSTFLGLCSKASETLSCMSNGFDSEYPGISSRVQQLIRRERNSEQYDVKYQLSSPFARSKQNTVDFLNYPDTRPNFRQSQLTTESEPLTLTFKIRPWLYRLPPGVKAGLVPYGDRDLGTTTQTTENAMGPKLGISPSLQFQAVVADRDSSDILQTSTNPANQPEPATVSSESSTNVLLNSNNVNTVGELTQSTAEVTAHEVTSASMGEITVTDELTDIVSDVPFVVAANPFAAEAEDLLTTFTEQTEVTETGLGQTQEASTEFGLETSSDSTTLDNVSNTSFSNTATEGTSSFDGAASSTDPQHTSGFTQQTSSASFPSEALETVLNQFSGSIAMSQTTDTNPASDMSSPDPEASTLLPTGNADLADFDLAESNAPTQSPETDSTVAKQETSVSPNGLSENTNDLGNAVEAQTSLSVYVDHDSEGESLLSTAATFNAELFNEFGIGDIFDGSESENPLALQSKTTTLNFDDFVAVTTGLTQGTAFDDVLLTGVTNSQITEFTTTGKAPELTPGELTTSGQSVPVATEQNLLPHTELEDNFTIQSSELSFHLEDDGSVPHVVVLLNESHMSGLTALVTDVTTLPQSESASQLSTSIGQIDLSTEIPTTVTSLTQDKPELDALFSEENLLQPLGGLVTATTDKTQGTEVEADTTQETSFLSDLTTPGEAPGTSFEHIAGIFSTTAVMQETTNINLVLDSGESTTATTTLANTDTASSGFTNALSDNSDISALQESTTAPSLSTTVFSSITDLLLSQGASVQESETATEELHDNFTGFQSTEESIASVPLSLASIGNIVNATETSFAATELVLGQVSTIKDPMKEGENSPLNIPTARPSITTISTIHNNNTTNNTSEEHIAMDFIANGTLDGLATNFAETTESSSSSAGDATILNVEQSFSNTVDSTSPSTDENNEMFLPLTSMTDGVDIATQADDAHSFSSAAIGLVSLETTPDQGVFAVTTESQLGPASNVLLAIEDLFLNSSANTEDSSRQSTLSAVAGESSEGPTTEKLFPALSEVFTEHTPVVISDEIWSTGLTESPAANTISLGSSQFETTTETISPASVTVPVIHVEGDEQTDAEGVTESEVTNTSLVTTTSGLAAGSGNTEASNAGSDLLVSDSSTNLDGSHKHTTVAIQTNADVTVTISATDFATESVNTESTLDVTTARPSEEATTVKTVTAGTNILNQEFTAGGTVPSIDGTTAIVDTTALTTSAVLQSTMSTVASEPTELTNVTEKTPVTTNTETISTSPQIFTFQPKTEIETAASTVTATETNSATESSSVNNTAIQATIETTTAQAGPAEPTTLSNESSVVIEVSTDAIDAMSQTTSDEVFTLAEVLQAQTNATIVSIEPMHTAEANAHATTSTDDAGITLNTVIPDTTTFAQNDNSQSSASTSFEILPPEPIMNLTTTAMPVTTTDTLTFVATVASEVGANGATQLAQDTTSNEAEGTTASVDINETVATEEHLPADTTTEELLLISVHTNAPVDTTIVNDAATKPTTNATGGNTTSVEAVPTELIPGLSTAGEEDVDGNFSHAANISSTAMETATTVVSLETEAFHPNFAPNGTHGDNGQDFLTPFQFSINETIPDTTSFKPVEVHSTLEGADTFSTDKSGTASVTEETDGAIVPASTTTGEVQENLLEGSTTLKPNETESFLINTVVDTDTESTTDKALCVITAVEATTIELSHNGSKPFTTIFPQTGDLIGTVALDTTTQSSQTTVSVIEVTKTTVAETAEEAELHHSTTRGDVPGGSTETTLTLQTDTTQSTFSEPLLVTSTDFEIQDTASGIVNQGEPQNEFTNSSINSEISTSGSTQNNTISAAPGTEGALEQTTTEAATTSKASGTDSSSGETETAVELTEFPHTGNAVESTVHEFSQTVSTTNFGETTAETESKETTNNNQQVFTEATPDLQANTASSFNDSEPTPVTAPAESTLFESMIDDKNTSTQTLSEVTTTLQPNGSNQVVDMQDATTAQTTEDESDDDLVSTVVSHELISAQSSTESTTQTNSVSIESSNEDDVTGVTGLPFSTTAGSSQDSAFSTTIETIYIELTTGFGSKETTVSPTVTSTLTTLKDESTTEKTSQATFTTNQNLTLHPDEATDIFVDNTSTTLTTQAGGEDLSMATTVISQITSSVPAFSEVILTAGATMESVANATEESKSAADHVTFALSETPSTLDPTAMTGHELQDITTPKTTQTQTEENTEATTVLETTGGQESSNDAFLTTAESLSINNLAEQSTETAVSSEATITHHTTEPSEDVTVQEITTVVFPHSEIDQDLMTESANTTGTQAITSVTEPTDSISVETSAQVSNETKTTLHPSAITVTMQSIATTETAQSDLVPDLLVNSTTTSETANINFGHTEAFPTETASTLMETTTFLQTTKAVEDVGMQESTTTETDLSETDHDLSMGSVSTLKATSTEVVISEVISATTATQASPTGNTNEHDSQNLHTTLETTTLMHKSEITEDVAVLTTEKTHSESNQDSFTVSTTTLEASSTETFLFEEMTNVILSSSETTPTVNMTQNVSQTNLTETSTVLHQDENTGEFAMEQTTSAVAVQNNSDLDSVMESTTKLELTGTESTLTEEALTTITRTTETATAETIHTTLTLNEATTTPSPTAEVALQETDNATENATGQDSLMNFSTTLGSTSSEAVHSEGTASTEVMPAETEAENTSQSISTLSELGTDMHSTETPENIAVIETTVMETNLFTELTTLLEPTSTEANTSETVLTTTIMGSSESAITENAADDTSHATQTLDETTTLLIPATGESSDRTTTPSDADQIPVEESNTTLEATATEGALSEEVHTTTTVVLAETTSVGSAAEDNQSALTLSEPTNTLRPSQTTEDVAAQETVETSPSNTEEGTIVQTTTAMEDSSTETVLTEALLTTTTFPSTESASAENTGEEIVSTEPTTTPNSIRTTEGVEIQETTLADSNQSGSGQDLMVGSTNSLQITSTEGAVTEAVSTTTTVGSTETAGEDTNKTQATTTIHVSESITDVAVHETTTLGEYDQDLLMESTTVLAPINTEGVFEAELTTTGMTTTVAAEEGSFTTLTLSEIFNTGMPETATMDTIQNELDENVLMESTTVVKATTSEALTEVAPTTTSVASYETTSSAHAGEDISQTTQTLSEATTPFHPSHTTGSVALQVTLNNAGQDSVTDSTLETTSADMVSSESMTTRPLSILTTEISSTGTEGEELHHTSSTLAEAATTLHPSQITEDVTLQQTTIAETFQTDAGQDIITDSTFEATSTEMVSIESVTAITTATTSESTSTEAAGGEIIYTTSKQTEETLHPSQTTEDETLQQTTTAETFQTTGQDSVTDLKLETTSTEMVSSEFVTATNNGQESVTDSAMETISTEVISSEAIRTTTTLATTDNISTEIVGEEISHTTLKLTEDTTTHHPSESTEDVTLQQTTTADLSQIDAGLDSVTDSTSGTTSAEMVSDESVTDTTTVITTESTSTVTVEDEIVYTTATLTEVTTTLLPSQTTEEVSLQETTTAGNVQTNAGQDSLTDSTLETNNVEMVSGESVTATTTEATTESTSTVTAEEEFVYTTATLTEVTTTLLPSQTTEDVSSQETTTAENAQTNASQDSVTDSTLETTSVDMGSREPIMSATMAATTTESTSPETVREEISHTTLTQTEATTTLDESRTTEEVTLQHVTSAGTFQTDAGQDFVTDLNSETTSIGMVTSESVTASTESIPTSTLGDGINHTTLTLTEATTTLHLSQTTEDATLLETITADTLQTNAGQDSGTDSTLETTSTEASTTEATTTEDVTVQQTTTADASHTDAGLDSGTDSTLETTSAEVIPSEGIMASTTEATTDSTSTEIVGEEMNHTTLIHTEATTTLHQSLTTEDVTLLETTIADASHTNAGLDSVTDSTLEKTSTEVISSEALMTTTTVATTKSTTTAVVEEEINHSTLLLSESTTTPAQTTDNEMTQEPASAGTTQSEVDLDSPTDSATAVEETSTVVASVETLPPTTTNVNTSESTTDTEAEYSTTMTPVSATTQTSQPDGTTEADGGQDTTTRTEPGEDFIFTMQTSTTDDTPSDTISPTTHTDPTLTQSVLSTTEEYSQSPAITTEPATGSAEEDPTQLSTTDAASYDETTTSQITTDVITSDVTLTETTLLSSEGDRTTTTQQTTDIVDQATTSTPEHTTDSQPSEQAEEDLTQGVTTELTSPQGSGEITVTPTVTFQSTTTELEDGTTTTESITTSNSIDVTQHVTQHGDTTFSSHFNETTESFGYETTSHGGTLLETTTFPFTSSDVITNATTDFTTTDRISTFDPHGETTTLQPSTAVLDESTTTSEFEVIEATQSTEQIFSTTDLTTITTERITTELIATESTASLEMETTTERLESSTAITPVVSVTDSTQHEELSTLLQTQLSYDTTTAESSTSGETTVSTESEFIEDITESTTFGSAPSLSTNVPFIGSENTTWTAVPTLIMLSGNDTFTTPVNTVMEVVVNNVPPDSSDTETLQAIPEIPLVGVIPGSVSSGSAVSASSASTSVTSSTSTSFLASILAAVQNAAPGLAVAGLFLAVPLILLITLAFFGGGLGRTADVRDDLLLRLFNDMYEDFTLDQPWILAKLLSQMFPDEFETDNQPKLLTQELIKMFPEQLQNLSYYDQISIPYALISLFPQKFANINFDHLDSYTAGDDDYIGQPNYVRQILLEWYDAASRKFPLLIHRYLEGDNIQTIRSLLKQLPYMESLGLNTDEILEKLLDRYRTEAPDTEKPVTEEPVTSDDTSQSPPAQSCKWGPLLCSLGRVTFQRGITNETDLDYPRRNRLDDLHLQRKTTRLQERSRNKPMKQWYPNVILNKLSSLRHGVQGRLKW